MPLTLWIDPTDDGVVTKSSPDDGGVIAIADKSDSGNDVVGLSMAQFLASFDGADAATSFTSEDAGQRVATFVANAQLDDAQSVFGGTSLRVDGAGDWLSFPDSPDYELGVEDFTIDLWVRFNGDPGTSIQWIIANYDSSLSPAGRSWALGLDNNDLRFLYSTTGVDTVNVLQAWNPEGDRWYHICMECFDDRLFHYVDGVQLGTEVVLTATLHQSPNGLDIGALSEASGYNSATSLDGNVDGVRITLGRAIHGDKIEVPDAEFTKEKNNPALLLNFNGVDGDTLYTSEDVNEFAIDFINLAEISDEQTRFGATCLKVNANNDSVEVPENAALTLGTGDFGIECWIHPTSTPSGTHAIYDQRSASGDIGPAIYLDSAQLRYYTNSAIRIQGDNVTIDAWNHVLLQRINAVTRLYLNGVQGGVDYADTNNYILNKVGIGDLWYANGNGLIGYIDGVRVKVGAGLYPHDFDLPVDAPGEPIV